MFVEMWQQAACFPSYEVSNDSSCFVQVQSKFILALCFSFLFMIVEVIGGYFANRWVLYTSNCICLLLYIAVTLHLLLYN